MKRWQDYAVANITASFDTPRPSFLSAALRFRVGQRDESVIEAQTNDVPFTPIWWWWNRDEDEYVMTMWDTEAGKDGPANFRYGFTDPRHVMVPPSMVNIVRRLVDKK